MLPQEVVKSLENIRSAFLELSATIESSENSEEIWEKLAFHYPFPRCFNELTTEVCAWVEGHTGGPYIHSASDRNEEEKKSCLCCRKI